MNSVGRKSKMPLITDTRGSAARGNDALRIKPRPLINEREPAIRHDCVYVKKNTAQMR